MIEPDFLHATSFLFTQMGRKLDRSTLRDVIVDLAQGQPFKTITKRRLVDRKTVKRIELSLDLYGQPYPPTTVVQGRPRLLLKFQEDVSHHHRSILFV
jgi:hypothetical protein